MMNIANQLHLTFKISFGPACFHNYQPFYCNCFSIFQQTLSETKRTACNIFLFLSSPVQHQQINVEDFLR